MNLFLSPPPLLGGKGKKNHQNNKASLFFLLFIKYLLSLEREQEGCYDWILGLRSIGLLGQLGIVVLVLEWICL